jgi:Zn-dependent M28 family amino/carboxypeptidase
MRTSRIVAPLVVLALLAGCVVGASAAPAQSGPGMRLANALDQKRIRAHLAALQRIADANGGTRSAGTPGYAASVRYVRDQLTRAGYRPRITSFPFTEYSELLERGLQTAPENRGFRVEAIDYSPSTPSGGLRGRVVAARGDGCEAADYEGVRGNVALALRGTCFIRQKAQSASGSGAVALIVYTTEPGPIDATLGFPGGSSIPVVAVEQSTAQLLQADNAAVELTIRTRTRRTTSQNVVADARPGARRVLLAGGHLDSVLAGAGVNDNGTGVAALLEIARALKRVSPQRPVRFAFWGAEEFGLFGSSAYAGSAAANDVASYLNFDMLGSRNRVPQRQVYVGPFAARWFDYFEARGLRATSIDIAGRSDHAPFAQRGIPTGGLFAGVDTCYHAKCDRLPNIDLTLLRELSQAAAYGVAEFGPR